MSTTGRFPAAFAADFKTIQTRYDDTGSPSACPKAEDRRHRASGPPPAACESEVSDKHIQIPAKLYHIWCARVGLTSSDLPCPSATPADVYKFLLLTAKDHGAGCRDSGDLRRLVICAVHPAHFRQGLQDSYSRE
jgi:hypothetical protein